MTDPIFYSPTQVYINKPANGGVETCKLESFAGTFGVAINQSVIAGVTGKRIRVMGYAAQSGATQGTYGFLNGSGGTGFSSFVAPPQTLPPFLLPVIDSGYFETSTGTGLFVNIATASVSFNVFYIIYTP